MQRPVVGLGVFIMKEGKFLLIKRKGAHGEGSWGLVGGHLEFGESFDDCAKREAQEEVGVVIDNIRFAHVTNDLFKEEQKHYLTIFCIAEYSGGEVTNRELDKCEQFGWFSWEEMPSPLFFPIVNLMKSGFNLNNVINNSWQHYKGNRYQVLGEGRHSDTLEEFIVYQGLYNSKEFGNKPIWIRPKRSFQDNVIMNGKEVPRFREL